MSKCSQCGKPAMVQMGDAFLCVDCHLKYQQAIDLHDDRLARQMNYLTEQMEATVGIPGMLPRHQVKQPSPVVHQGDMTFNNIKVDRSVVGAINTGNIQSIDVAMNNIKASGNEELAQELSKFTEEVIKERELSEELKNSVLEQVAFLVQECQVPKEKQKKSIIGNVSASVGKIVSAVESLSKLWEKIEDLFKTFF